MPGVFLPARFIPTPTTISPEAQACLSNLPPISAASEPDTDDRAAWRAHIDARDREVAALMSANAESHRSEVTAHDLSHSRLCELEPANFSPASIAVYGPSAGAGLAAACLLNARDIGLPMPAACVLHSAQADLTESGDSLQTNDKLDMLLSRMPRIVAMYAGGPRVAGRTCALHRRALARVAGR
jgi:hypothetical protein